MNQPRHVAEIIEGIFATIAPEPSAPERDAESNPWVTSARASQGPPPSAPEPRHERSGALRGCECDCCRWYRSQFAAEPPEQCDQPRARSHKQDAPEATQDAGRGGIGKPSYPVEVATAGDARDLFS